VFISSVSLKVFRIVLIACMTLSLLLGSASFPTSVQASGNIVVKSNADIIANNGLCTLREAIINANNDNQSGSTDCAAGSGADTITFAANYTITLAGSQLPVVTSTITITGNGAANTIIQANANPNTATYRVFEVSAIGNLTLDGLTIRHGRCNGTCSTYPTAGGGIYNKGILAVTNSTFSNNSAVYSGGGIDSYSYGNLTVTNSTFSGNSAPGDAVYEGFGGGIGVWGGTPNITNSTFYGNSADYGGGIASTPNLTVTNSTFSNNMASQTGGGIRSNSLVVANSTFSNNKANYGAGIEGSGNLTVTNSTFSNNSAVYHGGGIETFEADLTVDASTFSGNSAGVDFYGEGGGIAVWYGASNITNSTFSENSAADYGGGIVLYGANNVISSSTFSGNSAWQGGGLYQYAGDILDLSNTIIANSPSGGDCVNYGTINDDHNLIKTLDSACGLTNGVHGNIIGFDPVLGSLANNGGPTQTLALLPGSPALEAGNDATCPATDQRGVARPQGVHCDIGAYEPD